MADHLLVVAEVLAGAAHSATMAARAFRKADVEDYMPPGNAGLPHEPYPTPVDSYTTALRSIAACRQLVERFDPPWEHKLMGRLLDDVKVRQSLDWQALNDALEEELFGPLPDDDDESGV